MPIYEYECTKCHKHHEIMQKHSDPVLTICPSCGGQIKKLISNTSFVLKGTGWYKTDYAPSKSKPASEAAKGNGSASGEKTAAADTKTDTKTEPAKKTE